jgi:hypothetical protein
MRAFRVLLAALLLAPASLLAAGHRPLALIGGTIFTARDAEPIERGVVIVRDGKIETVGGPSTSDDPEHAQPLLDPSRTLRNTRRQLSLRPSSYSGPVEESKFHA